MAKNLITVSEYKTYVGISSNNQDAIIETLITKVSELVKNICRRTFVDYIDDYKIDTSRGPVHNRIILNETPILQVAGVQFSEDYGNTYIDLIEFTDYVVDQDSDAIEIISYPYVEYSKVNAFKITYSAGYEVIPQDLKLAIMDIITYYMKNSSAVHSNRQTTPNTMQVEYISSTQFPAHIQRVLDLYKANYL